MRIQKLIGWTGVWLGLSLAAFTSGRADDESQIARYYEQLRQRGFYRLAESHAKSRLADPLLPAERRIDLVIELSRTLTAHALSAAEDQQPELWDEAAKVLAEELAVATDSPRRVVLEVYAALVPATRTEQLVWDLEAAPFEEPLRESLEKSSQAALRQLEQAERSLADRLRTLEGRRKPVPGVSVPELRRLVSHLRLKTGFVLQARARLSPPGSQERHSDLIDADERFRKLTTSAGEETQAWARLGLAIGNRLRDELDLADEALEREAKTAQGELLDAIRLEQARVLLASRRPDDAAQLLLALRTGRERLPGEYWQTFFQTLAALRKVAAQRQAVKLVAELNERAQAALRSVDQQAGGAWSRRCREIWSAAESVERYGQQIAALISKGKSEFLLNRLDAATTAYASALELAQTDGKTDLEMEVGYTLAAIFAKRTRWDDVAHVCRQLVAAHPDHAQAAEVDALSLHALGMLYEQQRTGERKSAYERGLSEHLTRFRTSPTVSEAAFRRGQLDETAGQMAEALTAYRQVKPDHSRGLAAQAAAARCCVVGLLQQRESGANNREWEQRSLEVLVPGLKALPEAAAAWSDAQVELAYHGVRVLLLIEPPRFADADRLLNQLHEATKPAQDQAAHSELRQEIGRRTGPLRLIALAGQGRPQDAERLLGTLEQSGAVELLAVVEELSQLEIPSPAQARHSLQEMQLASAEALQRRRKELTPPQQRRLDLALAKSYLATSQITKAVDVYQQLLDDRPRDIEFARQLGTQMLSREELGCRALARTCWQRVESSCKQGSPEWLDARAEVIESHWRVGDHDQARKLLKVTRLLYAKSWSAEREQRYAELEQRLK